jgi:hypothetical protein
MELLDIDRIAGLAVGRDLPGKSAWKVCSDIKRGGSKWIAAARSYLRDLGHEIWPAWSLFKFKNALFH